MFVHAGASLHGHESQRKSSPARGSHQRQPSPRNRPVPLLRSALRPLSDSNIDVNSSSSSSSSTTNKHARFSLPSSSSLSPLPPGRRSLTEPISSTSASPLASPPASTLPSYSRPPPRRPVSDLTIRFSEATSSMASRASMAPTITTLPSEDEESLAGSDVSDYTVSSSTRSKRRRRSPKTSTRYTFGVPPPKKNLLKLRPDMLLQLRKADTRRGAPAFDVLPPSAASTSLLVPRLAKRYSRLLHGKPELGPDDLVIVKSEDYKSSPTTPKSANGRLENRDLMGVVSPLPDFGQDAAEIITGDGSIWSTSLKPNGSYEFHYTDSHGIATTARWAKRKTPQARRNSVADVPPSPASSIAGDNWTFSIIDPSSKRHPIMGTLDSNPRELVIYDTYSSLSASSGRFPPTKPFSNVPVSGEMPTTPSSSRSERTTAATPDEYKHLMIVTASWIMLRQQGWPKKSTHGRAASTSNVAERRRTFPLSNTLETPSPRPSFCARSSNERPTSAQPEVPKRHMSTGAAYMRRRRMETETDNSNEGRWSMKENVRYDGAPPVIRTKGVGSEEESTATCRIKVRRLTRRLFHRKAAEAKVV